VRGPGGTLWRGYHAAASLGRWTLTRTDAGWDLDAVVQTRHPIWAASGPFEVELTAPSIRWRWPIASLDCTGETAHAALPVRHP
jgi:hypothetical protein